MDEEEYIIDLDTYVKEYEGYERDNDDEDNWCEDDRY